MENLTLEDLRSHIKELNKLLKPVINYPYEILIKNTDEKDTCSSCCTNRPIGEIIIEFYKPTKLKRHGLLIYPTRSCHLPILDRDNNGAKISLQLYETVQNWFKTLSTSYERQSERVYIIERELIEKTWLYTNEKDIESFF
jgi:hypothetical protein